MSRDKTVQSKQITDTEIVVFIDGFLATPSGRNNSIASGLEQGLSIDRKLAIRLLQRVTKRRLVQGKLSQKSDGEPAITGLSLAGQTLVEAYLSEDKEASGDPAEFD